MTAAMSDDRRIPDHLRAIYIVVGVVVLLLLLPLLALMVLSLLAGDVMH